MIHKLTPKIINRIIREGHPGQWGDGGKLYLQINVSGSATWVFRYRHTGRARGMGLGPVHSVTLAAAREMAHRLREAVHEGRDPLDERITVRKVVTFAECCAQFFKSQAKALPRWEQTLQTYCGSIANLPVNAITTDHVLEVLRPLWRDHLETGRRVQGRIARVMEFAELKGLRCGANPAAWKGRLDLLLPSPSSHKADNLPAMNYRDVPQLMAQLGETDDIKARALQFVIAEQGDAKPPIRWSDIDLDERIWRIPKTKAGASFEIPLSAAAIDLLLAIKKRRPHDTWPFLSEGRDGSTLSRASLRRALEPLAPDVSVHGFRSSFRTWASEMRHDRELAETALNHRVPGNKVELAYKRTQLLDQRRALMEAWADHCMGRSKVISIAA
jgi:integrase